MTDEITYYKQRTETEFAQAQRATKQEAVTAHLALATAYLDRVAQLERRAL